jgi:prepilin-type N-terminal cleavage/methylation domain-containing protein
MKQGPRGFTLIELLVVIAIIGVLAAAVLTILTSARVSGRDSKRLGDVKELQTALQFYYDKNSVYPDFLSDLVTGKQIPIEPKDPRTGEPYFYDLTGAGSSYHLGTNLEDKNNKALKSDKDSVTDTINGGDGTVSQPSDCGGGSSSKLSCYDVVP